MLGDHLHHAARLQSKLSWSDLLPSHGMQTLVLSRPAATSKGLWARFWKWTEIAFSPMSMCAVASMNLETDDET